MMYVLSKKQGIIASLTLLLCVTAVFLLFLNESEGGRYADLHGFCRGFPEGRHRSRPPMEADHKMLDFEHVVPSKDMRNRYESVDVWRGDTIFDGSKDKPEPERPRQYPPSFFNNPAKYLEQTLVADYSSTLSEEIFVMLKTGGTVMWDRLPIHLVTTLTRVKNFALYSDLAGSVGGHEVIDILKDLPKEVLESDDMTTYRLMRKMHNEGYNWGTDILDLRGRKDGWATDRFKNIPMLADAYTKRPESKWFVFIDDDTFVMWDNLEQYLSKIDHKKPIYLGHRAWFPSPAVHNGKKVSFFAHGGSGVVLSKGAMDTLFGPDSNSTIQETIEDWSLRAMRQCCGDLMVAWALFEKGDVTLDPESEEYPMIRFQGEAVNLAEYGPEDMCEPLLTFHHLTGHDIEVLWEYERLRPKGVPTLYNDFYRDFVLPYVVEEREGWYMGRSTYTISERENTPFEDGDGKEIYPHKKKEDCRKACEKHNTCYVWSYWKGTCQLQHNNIVLGSKATRDRNDYVKKFGLAPRVTTGWMVDRIRELRASLKCDPLKYDKKTGEYNDSPETAEGWAIRALEAAEKQLNESQSIPPDELQSNPSDELESTPPDEINQESNINLA